MGGAEKDPSEAACGDQVKLDRQADAMEQRFGLSLRYGTNAKVIPELWTLPPVNGSAVDMQIEITCEYLVILDRELAKYPAGLLAHAISTISLHESLSFYDVPYAGTVLNDTVFLTGQSPLDDTFIAQLIHHELSSIFFHKFSFPRERWVAELPFGFEYFVDDATVLHFLRHENQIRASEELLRSGFVSNYGRTNLENDFNTFAELYFTDAQHLTSLAENYPRIAAKLAILTDFFNLLFANHADYHSR